MLQSSQKHQPSLRMAQKRMWTLSSLPQDTLILSHFWKIIQQFWISSIPCINLFPSWARKTNASFHWHPPASRSHYSHIRTPEPMGCTCIQGSVMTFFIFTKNNHPDNVISEALQKSAAANISEAHLYSIWNSASWDFLLQCLMAM